MRKSLLNMDLPEGVVRTKAGHLRFTKPKDLRNKYVHRVIAECIINATPYSIRLLLPSPYEVHHMDYNKAHNCPNNFLLLPEALHAKLTSDRSRDDGGRFGRKFFPRWKPESIMLPGMDDTEDAIPF